MLQPSIAVEALLICLFTACQGVSSFSNCKPIWDINGWICEPEDLWDSTTWILPVTIIIPIVIVFGCCLAICFGCRKRHGRTEETGPTEQPTVMISTQPPVFISPMPSAPPENQCIEPPPYTEVAWKPYPYPPAMGQPPAYDNIAMSPPQDAYHPQR